MAQLNGSCTRLAAIMQQSHAQVERLLLWAKWDADALLSAFLSDKVPFDTIGVARRYVDGRQGCRSGPEYHRVAGGGGSVGVFIWILLYICASISRTPPPRPPLFRLSQRSSAWRSAGRLEGHRLLHLLRGSGAWESILDCHVAVVIVFVVIVVATWS